MVKLSIMVPSYRPTKITTFAHSLRNLATHFDRDEIELVVVPHNELSVGKCASLGFDVIKRFPDFEDTLVPFVKMRWAGFQCCSGQYVMSMDDDHTAMPGSGQYLRECLDYMDARHDVGVFLTHGVWGSEEYGDTIHQPKGPIMILMSRGMIFRNDFNALMPTPKEMKLLGGMEETLYTYKMISKGYSIVRRYLNPTEQEPTKHFDKTDHPSYQTSTLVENTIGYIRKRWMDPNWAYGSDFPDKLLIEHSLERIMKGFPSEGEM